MRAINNWCIRGVTSATTSGGSVGGEVEDASQ
jgi:hypothetical protein